MVNKSTYYGYDGKAEDSGITKIAEIERRIAAKELQLKDVNYELVLLKSERLRIYQKNVHYFIHSFCENAQKWVAALKDGTIHGQKIDRRKNYPEKDSYDYLVNWINEKLDTQISISAINNYNFGEAWIVYFSANGHEWHITFPIVPGIKLSSLDMYGGYCFKIALHHKNEILSELVGATFDEDELKDIFKIGIENFAR